MTTRTQIVQNIIDGYDLHAGECLDLAYGLMRRGGMSEATLQKIRNVILLAFDGAEMMTEKIELDPEADSEFVRVKIVPAIPPEIED